MLLKPKHQPPHPKKKNLERLHINWSIVSFGQWFVICGLSSWFLCEGIIFLLAPQRLERYLLCFWVFGCFKLLFYSTLLLRVSSWLTWIILLKVYWPFPNLEVYGERCLGGNGPLLWYECSIQNGKIPQWCLVKLWEVNKALCFWCHDGLTISGTHLRRIHDVDMKRDYAFVVRISLFLFVFLLYVKMSGASPANWPLNLLYATSIILVLLVFHYFQEFADPRDADDAQYNLNGREIRGSRIVVEFSKGVWMANLSHMSIDFDDLWLVSYVFIIYPLISMGKKWKRNSSLCLVCSRDLIR